MTVILQYSLALTVRQNKIVFKSLQITDFLKVFSQKYIIYIFDFYNMIQIHTTWHNTIYILEEPSAAMFKSYMLLFAQNRSMLISTHFKHGWGFENG